MFRFKLADSNILSAKGVNIWNGNTTKEFLESRGLTKYFVGEMGPMYGYQWRSYGQNYSIYRANKQKTIIDDNNVIDQLKNVINLIINDPYSRRIMMTTYNPLVSDQGVLDPCHGIITQFYISNDLGKKYLNCTTYQRSSDMFLGVPFNIASYAALVHILCVVCKIKNDKEFVDLVPGIMTTFYGDMHIYENHIDAVNTQLDRNPIKFPKLSINPELIRMINTCYLHSEENLVEKLINIIDNFMTAEDFEVMEYSHYSPILAKIIA